MTVLAFDTHQIGSAISQMFAFLIFVSNVEYWDSLTPQFFAQFTRVWFFIVVTLLKLYFALRFFVSFESHFN